MKPIQFILFMLCMVLLCGTSCEKEIKEWTELPPETQKGANTIGCLVDGKLWATSKLPGIYKFPPMKAEYRDYGNTIHLDFYAEGKEGIVGFTLVNPILGANNAKVYCKFNLFPKCTIMVDDIGGLYITKMDLDNKILSGRFAFDVPCKKDTTKLLHVTEGRFDLYMSVLR